MTDTGDIYEITAIKKILTDIATCLVQINITLIPIVHGAQFNDSQDKHSDAVTALNDLQNDIGALIAALHKFSNT